MKLANRVAALTPSSTLAITAKAKELKAAGHDVIGLGAGEPDFNTPDHIIEAAIKAMKEGHTKYTPSAGLPSLKQAICNKLLKDQQLEYKPNEVIVGTGAKFVLYALFQVLLNKDDEVIIPTPYWVSYPEQVKLAEGVPVYVEGKEENNFKVTVEQLEAAITNKTVALVLNSPSNPTGMLYSQEELKAIGELCVKHDILIVSDEIYEKLVYFGAAHYSIAQVSEEVKAKTVLINGLSKSHSMTGWRIGYAAGPVDIIKSMTDLSSHSVSNPTSIAQYASIAAYEGSQEPVETMRQAFEHRLDVIYDKLVSIPGISCKKPQGAFYLFPNAKKCAELTGFDNVDDFAKALLEEALVAVVPGSGFGAPNNIRLSYATSLEQLEIAIDRIRKFVEEKM
ncbi:pyridoxal phosphate-dependent aminotransferase [Fredinandcohnia onubensis]|jgi:aspartate aminotransferase|uniref:pyridoxal phosphate-dependent aminotransferase n=1 Tax=Fredinandcohnia onubensis TaxID=1571209 RepID=UPI000C0BED60|nr:pyridoxal phosphate-dependent aminotransferase [Fredinandcohnia onubensis]